VHGLLGAFVGLLLLLLLISLAVTVIRSVISKAGGDRDRQDSLEILRVKLARGEISAEEYQRIRGILRG